MKKMIVMVFVAGVLILVACASSPGVEAPMDSPEPTATESPSPEPTETQPDPLTLEEAAEEIVNALAEKDLERVASFGHPEMGIRLSPYAYVEDSHLVFVPKDLPTLVGSDEVFIWGAFDGTGDPIELTFDDYYERFLYSADFTNPEQMGVNERIGQGNSLDNITEFYPGSSFVEFHFSGFEEQFGGMDWVSLRLVFIQEDGTWFLVGMVNDQWTI